MVYKKGIPLDLDHLLLRGRDGGDWKEKLLTQEQFTPLLKTKIQAVSFTSIRQDLVRFIPDDKVGKYGLLNILKPGSSLLNILKPGSKSKNILTAAGQQFIRISFCPGTRCQMHKCACVRR